MALLKAIWILASDFQCNDLANQLGEYLSI